MKICHTFIFLIFLLKTESESLNRTARIIGGYHNAKLDLDLAKYIVSLRLGNDGGIYGSNHFCAGTIISKRTILTANHCVINLQNGRILNKDYLTVIAGNLDRLIRSKFERSYSVKEIICYPKFNFTIHGGDLALLKLTEDIQEDGVHIQRADLSNDMPMPGERCIALGWGKILFNGPLADKIVYLNATILPIRDCMFFAQISVGVICAGEVIFQEKTAGPGDSGGPLFCNRKLTGVISFIVPIRTYMSSVWYFREWILVNGATSNNFYLTSLISISVFKIFQFCFSNINFFLN